MNNFPAFADIRLFFEWGCYTTRDLSDYVKLGCLTESEYEEICGEAYKEQSA